MTTKLCSVVRDAVSAAADGEDPGIASATVDRHLQRCSSCRVFASGMPDLSGTVLSQAASSRAVVPFLASPVRIALAFVGVAQLAMAVPGLIFGTDEGAPIHVAHEAGAWDLALAVGFLLAAWRPLRAVGMFPFAAALGAGLVLTALIDVVHGRQPALTETPHLLELVGTGLLWLLTAPRPRARSPRTHASFRAVRN
jgi:predicted anti-sigma-YlaC factor YlaD